MPDKFFLDTNIIVYSFDQTEPSKQNTARKLVKDALTLKTGIISSQVIQEFINVAVQKFKNPLTPADCKKYVENFLSPICEIFPSLQLFHKAIDIRSQTGYGFYDSLIVAAALEGKASILYSEDLQHGRIIDDLEIVNPFLPKASSSHPAAQNPS